jgi:hypothetical protein
MLLRMILAGSPGIRWRIENEIRDTPMSTGIALSNRIWMYRSTKRS